MTEQERKERVIVAITLLQVLARLGAVLATGGFENCDPCECFIAFPKRVRPIMRQMVRDHYDRTDYGETRTQFESTFGWSTYELAKHSEQEMQDLAFDLVNDSREDELADLIVDRKGWTTVPLPY